MHAAKVEVALWWHVGDVGCYAPLLAQLVDLRRGLGVINGSQDHVYAVEIRGLEFAVDIINLALFYAVGDFLVETVAWGYEGDFGIGIEHVHDATGSDLGLCQPSIPRQAHSKPKAYLAASDHQDALIAYLPCQNQGATTLDLGIGSFHCGG